MSISPTERPHIAPVPTPDSARDCLHTATFCDSFAVTSLKHQLDAPAAAAAIFAKAPWWGRDLLRLRNAIGAFVGLKAAGNPTADHPTRLTPFPIVSQRPDRVVMGFDDWHLNFRIVVDVSTSDASHSVTVTSLVRTKNWAGKAYLALIMPFHRVIVPSTLNGLTRA